MDATAPGSLLAETGTNSLLMRLWREHICTAIAAGCCSSSS